jgi:hypothetical protein
MENGKKKHGDNFAFINAPVALYFATYFNLKYLDQDPLKYVEYMKNDEFAKFV